MITDLSLEKIKCSNSKFYFFHRVSAGQNQQLKHMIRSLGFLTPLWVFQTEPDAYHLIDGFNRIKIAKELGFETVPVHVFTLSDSLEEVCKAVLIEKHASSFSTIQKSYILQQLLKVGLNRPVLIHSFLTLLGFPNHPEMLRKALKLMDLPLGLQILCHDKQFSLKICFQISQFNTELLSKFSEIRDKFHFSASTLIEILDAMNDDIKATGQSVHHLFTQPDIHALMNKDVSPQVRTEELRQLLQQKRHPIQNEVNAHLLESIEQLKLPQGAAVSWDKTLENKAIDISFKIQKKEQFDATQTTLQDNDFKTTVLSMLEKL